MQFEFLHACADGDLRTMCKHIFAGVDLDMPDAGRFKPLAVALDQGQVEAMRFLLAAGANPNSKYVSEPLLHWAFRLANKDAVMVLLEAGADPLSQEWPCYTIIDPATRSHDERMVDLALELLRCAGADMQAEYDEGLNAAVLLGDVLLAQKFLELGASPDSAGPDYSPLVQAARRRDRLMVNLLVRAGARSGLYLPEVQKLLGKEKCATSEYPTCLMHCGSPLYRAVLANDANRVRALLASGNNPNELHGDGDPVFFHAVRRGNIAMLHAFIDAGVDLLQTDKWGGRTAMSAATESRDYGTMALILANMVSAGAGFQDLLQESLFAAVGDGNTELVNLMLVHGFVDPDCAEWHDGLFIRLCLKQRGAVIERG